MAFHTQAGRKEDYLGSQMKNGVLTVRKSKLGGMKDRIVNGHHPKFGKIPRKKVFPEQMRKENISELMIYWWVTKNNDSTDIPTEIETRLRDLYFGEYGKLPDWHKQ